MPNLPKDENIWPAPAVEPQKVSISPGELLKKISRPIVHEDPGPDVDYSDSDGEAAAQKMDQPAVEPQKVCIHCKNTKVVEVSDESVMACPYCVACDWGCSKTMYCVSCKIHTPKPKPEAGSQGREPEMQAWREMPVGHWFFHESPECTNRYSVQERTDSGYTLICSTPWHHDSAKSDMQTIAKLHNSRLLAQARTQPAPKCPKCGSQASIYWMIGHHEGKCNGVDCGYSSVHWEQFFTALPEATNREE